MELEKYSALVCAIETGSISAAALKLRYTPSGISRMIASLEMENGFPLLLREHDGVRPTEECKLLLPRIYEMLHSGETYSQLAAQIRGCEVGSVMIGTAYSIFYPWLGKIVQAFHRQYPKIQIDFTDGFSTGLLEKLNLHQIDFCIISQREGNHKWMPISRDRLLAWVPAAYRFADLPVFPIQYFAEEPYVSTFPNMDIDATRAFEQYGIRPKQVFSTWNSLATYSMVEAGIGLSLNHEFNAKSWTGSVRMLPVDPPQIVRIGVAYLPDINYASMKFLEVLKEHLHELTPLQPFGAELPFEGEAKNAIMTGE